MPSLERRIDSVHGEHRVTEAEGSANARGAHATRLLPSRSRGHSGGRNRSRSGTAHAPSPDVRCGPPGPSAHSKLAALRHPWLRWPPTPAPGARAAPPRTSIREDGGGGGIGERLRSAGPLRPKRRDFCRPAAGECSAPLPRLIRAEFCRQDYRIRRSQASIQVVSTGSSLKSSRSRRSKSSMWAAP